MAGWLSLWCVQQGEGQQKYFTAELTILSFVNCNQTINNRNRKVAYNDVLKTKVRICLFVHTFFSWVYINFKEQIIF